MNSEIEDKVPQEQQHVTKRTPSVYCDLFCVFPSSLLLFLTSQWPLGLNELNL
jgi:hypothetical protein